jgi:hypothetical protein
MLLPTLPCKETVAVPGVPGDSFRPSHPVNAAMASTAAMILMSTFRTLRLLGFPFRGKMS